MMMINAWTEESEEFKSRHLTVTLGPFLVIEVADFKSSHQARMTKGQGKGSAADSILHLSSLPRRKL